MTNTETVWEVPQPLSTLDVPVDGDTVITLRRHGNPEGQRLVLSHGNGLAIDLYYPFWSLLTEEFDLIIYDLRSHGWNTVGTLENHNLPTLVRDHDRILEAIDRNYGQKPQIGVYHSISALATLLSPGNGSAYSALVLFDPPICRPGASYEELEAAATRAAAMARRRTARFPTREVVCGPPPIPTNLPACAVPGVYDLVAQTTLRAVFRCWTAMSLRCPRDHEAQIIEYAGIFAVSVDFGKLLCPTKVIGADPTLPYSYLPTLDLGDMLGVDYDFLPETTHFLQLEQPQECADGHARVHCADRADLTLRAIPYYHTVRGYLAEQRSSAGRLRAFDLHRDDVQAVIFLMPDRRSIVP